MSQPQLVRNLLQSTYVDDIVTGVKDEDNAYKLYTETTYVKAMEVEVEQGMVSLQIVDRDHTDDLTRDLP